MGRYHHTPRPMPTVAQLRQQARERHIKNYSKLSKAQLMAQLGVGNAPAKPPASQGDRHTKAAESLSGKLGGKLKTRLMKAAKESIASAEKQAGRKLSDKEKRRVAAKALRKEADAIRQAKGKALPRATAGTASKGLSKEQMATIAAHVKAHQEGKSKAKLHRVLRDKDGQHWAEFHQNGKVAAVPMDRRGNLDKSAAKHGEEWEKHSRGMEEVAGRKGDNDKGLPPNSERSESPKVEQAEAKTHRKSTRQKKETAPKQQTAAPTKARRKSSKGVA